MKLYSFNISATDKGIYKTYLIDFTIQKEYIKPDFICWDSGFIINGLGLYFMYQKQKDVRL